MAANETYEQMMDATANPIDRFFLAVAPYSRHIALLAAWTALCGSLFFSEVLGYIPCTLCWYQRILMYPLGIVIAIGILRRDTALHLYVLPLSLLGACVSLYHYLLIKTDLFPPPACSSGVPCTVDYIDWFGFINIPFMALTAFLIVALMMVLSLAVSPEEEQSPDARPDEAVSTRSSRLGTADFAVFGIIALVVLAFVAGAQAVRI